MGQITQCYTSLAVLNGSIHIHSSFDLHCTGPGVFSTSRTFTCAFTAADVVDARFVHIYIERP